MAKWALGLAAGIVALLLLALIVHNAIRDGPYQEIREALWQVELGSPMEDVSVTVPFEPIRRFEHSDTRSGRAEIVWYYDHHPVAAVIPQVLFDKQSRRVIAVYVDDVRHGFHPGYLSGDGFFEVNGVIVDCVSREPLPGVTVHADLVRGFGEDQHAVQTDEEGRFELLLNEPADLAPKLALTHPDYQSVTKLLDPAPPHGELIRWCLEANRGGGD